MQLKKKIIEILKISAYFTIIAFIISMLWLLIEIFLVNNPKVNMSNISQFLLFLLGYGEISIVNNIGKIIISIIGIVIISFISAFFTVNLFDWRNKIKISHEMIVWQYNQSNNASILISNNVHDIYNLKISLCLYFDGNSILMEKTYPYIPKKENTIVSFNIDIGNALYEFFYKTIKEERNDLYLTLIASYIDENNGQQYMLCNNYRWNSGKVNIIECRNFVETKQNNLREFAKIAAKAKIEEDNFFENYIKDIAYPISIHSAICVNTEFIKIEFKKAPATGREILEADIDLSLAPVNNDAKNYTMALISNPLEGNWQEYYLKNFILRFDIYISEGLVVKLELKDEYNNHILKETFYPIGNEYQTYTYDLHNCNQEKWKFIKEMCFTVFKKDIKLTKGSFSIIGCELAQKEMQPEKNMVLTSNTEVLLKSQSIKFEDLNKTQQNLLLKYGQRYENIAQALWKNTTPVYWVDDNNNFHFIENYYLKDKKGFKNSTALKQFYRGGGVMCIQVLNCGFIVVYDERNKWYKFPGGEAKFREGNNLLTCAIREALLEEVIFTGNIDNQEKLLYVEAQRKKIHYKQRIFKKIWNRSLKTEYIDATPVVSKYIRNITDRSIDVISKLDFTAQHLYSVYIVEDKWADGSRFMPLVSVINYEGQLIGEFNNRQGLVIHDPVNVNLHPAVKTVVKNLCYPIDL